MAPPSGEKVGHVAAIVSSVPAMGFPSGSEMERRYNRLFASYTICLPSREIAIGRFTKLNNSFSGTVTVKRATGGGDDAGLNLQTAAPETAAARAIPTTTGTARFHTGLVETVRDSSSGCPSVIRD